MHEHVAGIDVHKDMVKVAVRSLGKKKRARKTEILTCKTFYGVLQVMARDLRARGVTHVAMEASGVYTGPVYYALAEDGSFEEIFVVNPLHVKAVPGAEDRCEGQRGSRSCWSAACCRDPACRRRN